MTARAKAREATAVLWCRLAVQLCAGLLSALIAGHAVAADFREEGLGGTGVAPMDEGVGGTGLTAGGDDDGIGGTGIMGTITGFGSILANGLKVEYDGGTPVEIDGQPASAGELAIGQVTTIEAERIGEELRARRISLHFEVTGPLAGFDLARGELSVLGQTVKLGSGARVYDRGLGQSLEASDLRVGDFVRVSGLRRGDGVIVASRLERGPPQHEVRLSGPVSKVESGAFRLAGLRLGFLPEVSAIAPGKRVIVSGLWERGKLRAVHVRPEPEELFSARLEEISVEGYATDRGRNGSFRLHGLEVDLSELEDEERRQLPRVDGGVRVRVSGRLHAGHRVAALQIDFEDEERGGWISLRARSEEREEHAAPRERSAPRESGDESVRPAKALDSDDDSDGDSEGSSSMGTDGDPAEGPDDTDDSDDDSDDETDVSDDAEDSDGSEDSDTDSDDDSDTDSDTDSEDDSEVDSDDAAEDDSDDD